MAEAMLRDMLRRKGMPDAVGVDSAATTEEEIGHPMYRPAARKLRAEGVPTGDHVARLFTMDDYRSSDLVVCMDRENAADLFRMTGGDPDGKVRMLLAFAGDERDVADPWYTGDFDRTYREIEKGLKALLRSLGLRGLGRAELRDVDETLLAALVDQVLERHGVDDVLDGLVDAPPQVHREAAVLAGAVVVVQTDDWCKGTLREAEDPADRDDAGVLAEHVSALRAPFRIK